MATTQDTALEPHVASKGNEDTTSSSTSSSKPVPPAKNKHDKGNGLVWIAIVLLFACTLSLGGGAYWYYQQAMAQRATSYQTQQANAAAVNQLVNSFNTAQQQIQALTENNTLLEQQVSQLNNDNQNLAQQAESTLEQMKMLEGRRPADWLIAEADYLVRMAGRKVWLDNDIRTAILLLVNADKRLGSLADPSLLPVRSQIAEDIQTLQNINSVSVSAIALSLSGMLSQIDALPLIAYEKPVDVNAQDTTLSSSTADWRTNMAKVWTNIKATFFTVKTLEGPIEPVLTQETQWLIREQLRYQLMLAQSAALDHNSTLFNQSLAQAQDILIKRFKTESSQVSGYLSALQNLENTDISRTLPSELVSQRPLSDLLDERVRQVFGQGANTL